ncbi:Beta-N-acetylhexosaminidase [Clostridium bornimense]|uniref:Beta-N-acetylhexosaminidase n=1 Tax=Clostridium bornimense TaxID=1216932 RepID=W6SH12_9CLOT|nr:glycoside hydrolase family 3 protein [Clostridium bornimense]CDM68950.1 Beta-N-acetylhexosaminidase [Clostridium bornimense]
MAKIIKVIAILSAVVMSMKFGGWLAIECKNYSSERMAIVRESETDEEKIKRIRSIIDEMTIEEKIGQLIMSGFSGKKYNEDLKSLIVEEKIGGVIYSISNIEDVQQMVRLNNEIKVENENNKIPIFITVDEEGGSVSRMPSELMEIPTNEEIGKMNNENTSFNIGSAIGEEVLALGFNVNLAPVLDVNTNDKNTVIGDRSFGNDEELVSRLGIAMMNGMKESNVIAGIKHFPGYGDASSDSYVGLPVLENDLARLEVVEFRPFMDAIKAGADLVMVSNIKLTKVDSENPATMSEMVVDDILRRYMGYDGVIITDDMSMDAITSNYDIGDAAVKSILAGTDIIMVCNKYDNVIKVIDAINDAFLDEKITEDRIDESVERILLLKDKYNVVDNPIVVPDVEDINKKMDKALNGK